MYLVPFCIKEKLASLTKLKSIKTIISMTMLRNENKVELKSCVRIIGMSQCKINVATL